MGEAIRLLLNEAMRLERSQALEAEPYQRTDSRRGYANGYKPKTVDTRVGPIAFAVPQARGTGFYPSALERGVRSERALKLAIAEMYVQGVSTRKVTEVMRECAASTCPVRRSAGRLLYWMTSSKLGGTARWASILSSFWTQ
jgi:transposase-like protein